MSFPKRSNEPGEELYRVKSDPPPPGDDPHAAATKVGSMPIIQHLMREAESSLGVAPRSRPAVSAPPRPDSPPKSGARASEIPRIADETDALLEPTLIAEPPPDSIDACASGKVEAAPGPAVPSVATIDVAGAVANEMRRMPAPDEGAIPKLSSDDDGLLTGRGTELMVVDAAPASLLDLQMRQPVAPTGPKAAFPDWIGVSMKFDPLADRRRELMIRAAIALGAFVITASVLLWMLFG